MTFRTASKFKVLLDNTDYIFCLHYDLIFSLHAIKIFTVTSFYIKQGHEITLKDLKHLISKPCRSWPLTSTKATKANIKLSRVGATFSEDRSSVIR